MTQSPSPSAAALEVDRGWHIALDNQGKLVPVGRGLARGGWWWCPSAVNHNADTLPEGWTIVMSFREAAERAKPDFVAALRAEIEQMDQWERLCLLDSAGNTVYVNINYVGDGGEYDALDEGAKAKSERAKPAASDLAQARSLVSVWGYASLDLDELATHIAAALDERGEREREHAAQVAECFDLGTPEGHAIAAVIRNQTLTGDLA